MAGRLLLARRLRFWATAFRLGMNRVLRRPSVQRPTSSRQINTKDRSATPTYVGDGQGGDKPIAAAAPDAKPTRAHEKALALIQEMRREGPRYDINTALRFSLPLSLSLSFALFSFVHWSRCEASIASGACTCRFLSLGQRTRWKGELSRLRAIERVLKFSMQSSRGMFAFGPLLLILRHVPVNRTVALRVS